MAQDSDGKEQHVHGAQDISTFDVEGVIEIDPPESGLDAHRGPPLWTWLLLVAAVLAVSSAGVVFALMPDVPFLTLAGWRLQSSSVIMGVLAVYQFWRMPVEARQETLRQGLLLGVSGSCLAGHFGSWVYSVQHTSLSHSLLFVSATPLILAGGAWLLRKPISRGELAGTGVGMLGAVILATAAAKADQQVTVIGDMAALLASFAFVGYLLIGQRLRKWMPIFVYGFAVTSLAAALLTLAGVLVEGSKVWAAGPKGTFGYVADTRYLPKIVYLGIVPGILGHQGFNTLLRYMQPLIITLGCNVEPLIGSMLGWAVGVMAAPGAWTYVGGVLVMVSTVQVTVAAHFREKADAAVKAAEAKYAAVPADEAQTGAEREDSSHAVPNAQSSSAAVHTEMAAGAPQPHQRHHPVKGSPAKSLGAHGAMGHSTRSSRLHGEQADPNRLQTHWGAGWQPGRDRQ